MATRRWLRGTLPLLGEFQPLMSYLSYERVLSSSQQRLASSQHPSACAWNAAGLGRRSHARACEGEGKSRLPWRRLPLSAAGPGTRAMIVVTKSAFQAGNGFARSPRKISSTANRLVPHAVWLRLMTLSGLVQVLGHALRAIAER
jgi:hypothetical protein